MEKPYKCPRCGHGEFYRDADVSAWLLAVVDGDGGFTDFAGDLEDRIDALNIESWGADLECVSCGCVFQPSDDSKYADEEEDEDK